MPCARAARGGAVPQDFESKDYNVKAGKSYWQLGRLGPDLETQELQAKVRPTREPTQGGWGGSGGTGRQ